MSIILHHVIIYVYEFWLYKKCTPWLKHWCDSVIYLKFRTLIHCGTILFFHLFCGTWVFLHHAKHHIKLRRLIFPLKNLLMDFFFFSSSTSIWHCVTRSHTVRRSKWENTQSRWTSSIALSLRGLPFLCQLVFTPKPLPGKTTFLQPVMWKNCLPKVHTAQKKDRCVSFVSVIFRPIVSLVHTPPQKYIWWK